MSSNFEMGSDARDLYGRSKLLGEVAYPHCLTLRTSIIGPEQRAHKSLLDWVRGHHPGSQLKGYVNALYSGFTTLELAGIIDLLIARFPEMSGVYQVSSDPISKFDLIVLANEIFELRLDVVPDESFFCDRRLDSSRFRAHTGYQPPSWRKMLENLKPFL